MKRDWDLIRAILGRLEAIPGMIAIEIDDAQVRAMLDHLRDKVGEARMRSALAAIGEHLVETTQRRFDTSTVSDDDRSVILAIIERHLTTDL